MSSERTIPQKGEDASAERLQRREDDILAISGHHQQRVFPGAAKDVGRTHRADAHVGHTGAIMFGSMQERSADVVADSFEGRLLEHIFPGDHSQQFEAKAFKPFARSLGDRFKFLRKHLVHDDTDDLDILLVEERLVDRRLIDRTPNARRV